MTAPIDLDELLKLAKAATPGPWRESFWIGHLAWPEGTKATIMGHGPIHRFTGVNPEAIADAEFIAKANPETVTALGLALLDAVEALDHYRDLEMEEFGPAAFALQRIAERVKIT